MTSDIKHIHTFLVAFLQITVFVYASYLNKVEFLINLFNIKTSIKHYDKYLLNLYRTGNRREKKSFCFIIQLLNF